MNCYKKRIIPYLCALVCLTGFQSPIKSWDRTLELPIIVLGTILVAFYTGVVVGKYSVEMKST